MRLKPGLAESALIAGLRANYNLDITSVRFLPIGYDMNAFVYEAQTGEGASYFVKVRANAINPASLIVPRMLIERGISNILAPLRTTNRALWCALDSWSVIVYPFLRGQNAKIVGLTDDQWRAFGATLQAIHSGGFAAQLHGLVPAETFVLPSAALVRRASARVQQGDFASPAALELAAFWVRNAALIEHILMRAETLGKQLQSVPFEKALCHADIHAANIMVCEDGQIYLVDWDGPLLAPRERDLLFVVGCIIARTVLPREEALFFEGYGAFRVNRTALAYYRYERAIEDMGEQAKRVLLAAETSEEERASEGQFLMQLFGPGDIVQSALEADAQQGGPSLSL